MIFSTLIMELIVEKALREKLKRERRINLTKTILLTIAVVGFMVVIGAAPSLSQLLKAVSSKKKSKHYEKYGRTRRIESKLRLLEGAGLIKREIINGRSSFILTDKGKLKLVHYGEILDKQKRRRWDGNWRIVIYDIWERTRGKRDLLREILKNLGFKKLQNSVWIFPHDSEELIFLLKTDLRLGRGVLYMTVNSIEDDYSLRKIFNLS